MIRLMAALLAGVILASVAVADGLPPPPPKGKKYVTVSNEVALGKDVTGYVFVKQINSFRQPATYSKVELTASKPMAIPEPARRVSVTLLAVPQEAAKEFKSDEELFDAIKAKKVKGVASVAFGNTATVSDKVKGDSVKWTTTITAIDDKGIKKKVEGDGYEEPKPKDSKKDSPDDEDDAPTTTAQAPRGGVWMAGLAATLALTLGGFWLAGRTRRKA